MAVPLCGGGLVGRKGMNVALAWADAGGGNFLSCAGLPSGIESHAEFSFVYGWLCGLE